jgi:hypothetical protein
MNLIMQTILKDALDSLLSQQACIEEQIKLLRESSKSRATKSKLAPTLAKPAKKPHRRKNNVSPESRAKISAAQKAMLDARRVGAVL